jgi:hypothetical protein
MGLLDEYPHDSIVDGDALTKAIVGEAVRNGLIEKDVQNNFYTDDVESVIPSLLITVVLKMLHWARTQQCPRDERTCNLAARNGHLELMKWAI